MKRRNWGLAAVALGAAATGVWWRNREAAPPQAGPMASASEATSLWTQSFERVDGSVLPMSALQGQAVIINFWATWCPPCVREMPMLDRFVLGQAKGSGQPAWRLVGLAVDRRDAVARFLAEHPVSYDIAVASLDAIGWSRSLGNGSGGLPFTVAFDRQGRPVHQKLGEISEAELRSWAVPRS